MSGLPSAIGRYQILSGIARGGMGTLYAAWDPKLDRQIAIKLLTDDDDALRERFAREARSVARLHHPNIVTIFDVGEHDGQPFIAMEYVHGETLAAVIRNRVAMSVARKLEIIEQLADGLAYAHKIGIVHRDIKPANIMLELDGSVKILDFGIARLGSSTNVTVAGMLLGTLNYMSPEQAKGKPADNRSDLFAVGAVFYELLSYQQAFGGGFQDGVLHRVVNEPPEPLDSLCPGLDREIISVVMRALQKDPNDRYQDLGAMVADIRRILPRLTTDSATDATTVLRSPVTPEPPRRMSADREELARRRARQIEEHLERARRFFSAADYDAGIGACEQVLLLDAENATALEMLDQARLAIDERQAEEWLNEATLEIERGALTSALSKIERASALAPSLSRAKELRSNVDSALAAREQARQRAETLRSLIARGHELFDQGLFSDAIAVADEVLAVDADHSDARALKTRSQDAIEAREREVLNRRARDTVREARRLFAADDHENALDLLAGFEPPHDLVTQTLEQLKTEASRIAEQRTLEAERRAKRERSAAELLSARTEIDDGNFAGAITRLRNLQQSDGASPEILGLMREAEAAQKAHELAAKKAEDIAAHVSRAATLLARGNLEGALERVDAALALDPDHKAAQALRVKISDRLRAAAEEREAEAARRREREQQVQGAIARARQTAEHAVAINILGEALDLDPDHAEVKELLRSRQTSLEREEADRRRAEQAEAERQRAQQAEAERRRAQQAEAERKRAQQAEAEQKRAQQAQAKKQRAQQAEAERQRARQAEAERREAARHEQAARANASDVLAGVGTVPEGSKAAPRLSPSGPRAATPVAYYAIAAVLAAVVVGIIAIRFARTGSTTPTSALSDATNTTPALPSPGPSTSPTPPVPGPSSPPATEASKPEPGKVEPPPPTATVDSKASNDALLASVRRLAREQLTRGEKEQALSTINAGLKSRPADAELKTLLSTTLTEARARVRSAHEEASRAGDAATRSPSYAEALQKEPEVARLARAGRTDDAIRSAWTAADLFTKAVDESKRPAPPRSADASSPAGRAAIPPPVRPPDRSETPESQAAPPPRPTPAPAPPVSPPVSPAPPAETAPARPPVQAPPPQAAPAAPTPAAEEQAIRGVLQAYADAYSRLDANAVRRVFPSANEQALRQAFSGLKSLQVQAQGAQISLSGSTATVTCTWTSAAVGQVGGVQRASPKIVLRLQKSGDSWVIVDRR